MNRFQNRKAQDLQIPIPGCMGRMINIFDSTVGMAGTKLLTDKPHRDGSPNRRNRPDVVKKAIDPIVMQKEEKPITCELRKSSSSKKSGGTPMKMLIAQEMSKETESKRKAPSVIARLMGLDDALPSHQSVMTAKADVKETSHSSHVTLGGALMDCGQREDGYFDKSVSYEIHPCAHEKTEYRDVYEVWQQASRTSLVKDQSSRKERCNENHNERRMALVRQKFMEAKRLATDEKLLQSKEFQDALEVLSSNRDLFLKFLEEPNSLFSNHLKELHSMPPPPQTKRITLLKPSKTVEKQHYPVIDEHGWDPDKPQWNSSTTYRKADILSQPTRIVVLKPSPRKHHDMKPMVSSHISSPEMMEKCDFYRDLETTEATGSREVAKEITRQMRESLSSNRRDESLLSSVLSNGYVGDESSFHRSENGYFEEDGGNYSDTEIVTPTSRHSWDLTNRLDSPYSFSSFSRPSYSPESSVIREAKKRLSERWALVASNGMRQQEQMQVRRSSSTLGEMLAIPEVKKGEERSRSYGGEEDMNASTVCSSVGMTKNGDSEERSPWNLSRSKSVPVSSNAYDNIGLNAETPDSQIDKPIVLKEVAKSKSGRLSFKGKVTSLFFSRNKKVDRGKSIPSPLVGSDDRIQSGSADPFCSKNEDLAESVQHPEETRLVNSEEEPFKTSSTFVKDVQQGTISTRAVSLDKPLTSEGLSLNQDKLDIPEKSNQNQDQPSPTSVLDAPFGDDISTSSPHFAEIACVGHPQTPLKSPPIESVARSLSWDDTRLETSSLNTLNLSRNLPNENEEEQDWFLFVETLLSSTGLDNEKLNTVLTKWHSVNSPLDPMLIDKFLDHKEEEAKSRERRSSQRLLFDCVNSALLDIGRTTFLGAYPWVRACSTANKEAQSGVSLSQEVWVLVRDWFSGERKWELGETGNGSLVVDRLVTADVVGSGWDELKGSEIDEISKDIGGEVLEELVGEALADFTSVCLS